MSCAARVIERRSRLTGFIGHDALPLDAWKAENRCYHYVRDMQLLVASIILVRPPHGEKRMRCRARALTRTARAHRNPRVPLDYLSQDDGRRGSVQFRLRAFRRRLNLDQASHDALHLVVGP